MYLRRKDGSKPICCCWILNHIFLKSSIFFLIPKEYIYTHYLCVYMHNPLFGLCSKHTMHMQLQVWLMGLWQPFSMFSQVSRNIALEAFMIKPSSFTGMTCTAYQKTSASSDKPVTPDLGRWEANHNPDLYLNFKCNTGNLDGSLVNSSTRVSQYYYEYNLSILFI